MMVFIMIGSLLLIVFLVFVWALCASASRADDQADQMIDELKKRSKT